MENQKIDWGKYAKDELIEVLEHTEKTIMLYAPWVYHDVLGKIDRRRLDKLHEEVKRYTQEAHEARMKALRLQNTGRTTTKTLRKVEELWQKALELDRKCAAVEKKIDALIRG